jgi:preprotein translocase subunit SecA
MSNPAALLKSRSIELADGICTERADERLSGFEDFLRSVVAHFPKPTSQRRRVRRFVAAVNAHEASVKDLSAQELCAALRASSRRMRAHGFEDAAIAPAFAAIREGSRRVLGMRHHDVQLMGGWAILQGRIAEMQTGEGKTLVATLAACTAAAAGASVHVVTVNDYLATRDAQANKPLYEYLGLTVGSIKQGMSPDERRKEYAQDIVYVSNKEIVFDYLKDRLATGGMVQARLRLRRLYSGGRMPPVLLHGLHVAIVDEADSVLVDEARTPLIISETEKGDDDGALFHTALTLARRMKRDEHFDLSTHRELRVTEAGERFIKEESAGLGGVWDSALWRHELVEKGLSALYCFNRDEHYIVAEGKVQIVDEFTGRVMPDRSWERGLHQMIEAKENCDISGQRRTLSRMTYQRFFSRYLLLGGMTGTAAEIRTELRRVYGLDVFRIPTHKPSKRRRLPDRCWVSADDRWNAVAERAIELSAAGRAVLIGTRSVEASERLDRLFTSRGVAHQVLNARQDGEEANIVALAGEGGRITVATNMAGRGTDISLDAKVKELGGLHVILTEYHESPRIDRQLFGRSARQGQPGTVEALFSVDDELFTRYVPRLRKLAAAAPRRGRIPAPLRKLLVRAAQTIAEKRNERIRIDTLKQDRKLQSMLAFSGDPN